VSSPALVKALDEVLGEDAWELPVNVASYSPGEPYVRQWYAPISFPEVCPADTVANDGVDLGDEGGWLSGEGDDWSAEEDDALLRAKAQGLSWKSMAASLSADTGTVTGRRSRSAKQCRERWCGLQPWTAEADDKLLALYEEHGPAWSKMSGMIANRTKRQIRARAATLLRERVASARAATATAAATAAAEGAGATGLASYPWESVNRRRVKGKGWHVDIGPGFDTDWARSERGHPLQGLIVLVLLSDCPPGGGGTAFVSSSHYDVRGYLQAAGAAGVPHQELNSWCIKQVVESVADGSLQYDRGGGPVAAAAAAGVGGAGSTAVREEEEGGVGGRVIEQMVGVAGDAFLVVSPTHMHLFWSE
jgi:hypothetical protein